MHPSFGDWYRLVDLEPKGEVLVARWKAVEALAKNADGTAILDVVRLSLAKEARSTEFLTSFQEDFRKADPAFPASGNALELTVLGGSVWAQVLERKDAIADRAALVMCSACLQKSKVEKLKNQFHALARRYLLKRGAELRRVKPWPVAKIRELGLEPAVQPYIQALQAGQYPNAAGAFPQIVEKLEDWTKKTATSVRAVSTHAQHAFRVQQEQSEIAWWILGEYSRDLDVHLGTLPLAKASLIVAKELADLTHSSPGPASFRALLERMLMNADGTRKGTASIQEAINGSDRSQRESWVGADLLPRELEDLVPLHFGVLRSLETESPAAWLPAFRKGTGLDPKKDRAPLDLAEQFYAERLMLQALREGGND